MAPEDPLTAALDRLWQRNGPELRARAGRVLAALEAAGAGDGADRSAAAREAHVLAGALGTYGRPGSALFAAAEQLLADGAAQDPAALLSLSEQVRLVLPDLV